MLKSLDRDKLAATIPAPRVGDTKSLEARAGLGAEARAYHHLMDINLQVFDSVTDAAIRIIQRARRKSVGTGVFTCNVDHLMLMDKSASFREAYGRADVVTIDGAPLALLTKLTGTAEARRVTGVALTEALADQAEKDGLRLALVGGARGRGELAAQRLRETHSQLREIFTDSPQMGFEIGDEEDQRLVAELSQFQPDIVIVCLGAPKQELWIDQHRDEMPGAVMVGAGATIDFLSGHQPRAPRLFRSTGTEAVYRLVTDFKRLWRRYLVRDARFFSMFIGIVVGHLVARMHVRGSRRSHPVNFRPSGTADQSLCAACVAVSQ